MNDEQIEWFQAGGALNIIRQSRSAERGLKPASIGTPWADPRRRPVAVGGLVGVGAGGTRGVGRAHPGGTLRCGRLCVGVESAIGR